MPTGVLVSVQDPTEFNKERYLHAEDVLSTRERKDLYWETADELAGEVEQPDGGSGGHPGRFEELVHYHEHLLHQDSVRMSERGDSGTDEVGDGAESDVAYPFEGVKASKEGDGSEKGHGGKDPDASVQYPVVCIGGEGEDEAGDEGSHDDPTPTVRFERLV